MAKTTKEIPYLLRMIKSRIELLTDQLTARKNFMNKKEFKDLITTNPSRAATYPVSAQKSALASKEIITSIEEWAKASKNLDSGKQYADLAEDLKGIIDKEAVILGSIASTITHQDKKISSLFEVKVNDAEIKKIIARKSAILQPLLIKLREIQDDERALLSSLDSLVKKSASKVA